MVLNHLNNIAIAWLFLFLFVKNGISQVSVKATVNTDRISVNEPFELVYRTENATADQIQIPSVPGLSISKRSGTFSSFSIIQGKVSGFEEFTYTVTARKPGKYTIPPAKITIKGKVFLANSIQITVVAETEKKPAEEAEADVFFKASLSHNPIYLGQQTILHYDIYTNQNVINANFIKKPSFEHIYSKLLTTRHTGRNVVISKKQYYTQTIESFTLYAHKTGILRLEKADIEYKYEIPDKGNPFFNDVVVKTRKTNDLFLEVLPLPDKNVPINFSGAVGSFTFSASVDKKTITTDDMFRVTINIRGDGDPKYWKAPAWENMDGAKIYEPDLVSENIEIDKGREFTTRVYEYLVQVEKPTDFVLHPKFSFFDPHKTSYVELKDKPIIVKVLPGKTASPANAINDVQVTENQYFLSDNTYNNFILPAFILGLILLLIFTFLKIKKRKNIIQKPENKDNLSVVDKLHIHLNEAELFEQKEDHKAFFNAIMNAVYLYLKEKLNEGIALTDKKSTISLLQEKKVPSNIAHELERLLSSCELAVFAGQKPEMTDVIKDTKLLLDKMEKCMVDNIS